MVKSYNGAIQKTKLLGRMCKSTRNVKRDQTGTNAGSLVIMKRSLEAENIRQPFTHKTICTNDRLTQSTRLEMSLDLGAVSGFPY